MKPLKMFFAVFLMISGLLLPAREITVALSCSSACESYGNRDPRLIHGWGEMLGEFFTADVKILNFAKSGRSTKSFRAQGYWDKLLAAKPDYAILALGANDTPGKKHASTLPEFCENQRRYVAECRAIGTYPILCTLNQSMRRERKTGKPRFSAQGPLRKDRVPYSQAIRDVARETNTPCLELFDNQFKYMQRLGEERCAKFYRLYKLDSALIDPSHTNREGARFVAMIIAEELAKSNTPLAAKINKDAVAAAKKYFGVE